MFNFSKAFAALAITVAATATMSAEGLYLHVMTSGGDWQVLDLEKVDRLYFTDGTMKATDAADNTVATFPAASLESMQVNDDPVTPTDFSSIKSVASDELTEGEFTFSGQTVVFTGEQAPFEIYGLDGKRIIMISNYRPGQSVDVNALSGGVYVFKVGNSIKKVAVK